MSAKRPKPLSRERAPQPSALIDANASSAASDTPREPFWLTGIGLAWLVGFCLFFYSFALPNNKPWTRLDLWIALPDLFPVSQLVSAHWSNLAQRADLFGIAAFILTGAWGLGHLVLRLLRPPIDFASGERAAPERTVFAMALGLSGLSLTTLVCGLAGLLSRGLFVMLLAAVILAELVLRVKDRRRVDQHPQRKAPESLPARRPIVFWVILAALAPFAFVMWLGSMSPDVDFDILAYHFEGPKEFFLAGRISFLPHNVYTSFPFLTEMLVLLGMVLHGDWFWGAVAGKCVLFFFAPLTALALYAAGRRWFSPTAGLIAALVHLSTPWIDRISIIAYAEGGLTFYLMTSLLAAMIAVERLRRGDLALRQIFLVGLLAGSGMACKYTGLLQVVVPMGLATVIAAVMTTTEPSNPLRAALKTALAFALGLAVTIGPWLAKNVAETGNPVYPLAYSFLGGRGWSPELNAKFVPAHSAKSYRMRDLGQNVLDVVADNDWSSPLLYALAPLALLVPHGRRITLALWLLVVYLFFAWWGFTHRIDRFWVPMIPVAALLAGIGATWSTTAAWRWTCGAVIALALWFNLGLIGGGMDPATGIVWSDLSGYNAFLSDLSTARENAGYPYLAYMNHRLPKGAKVLCVGDGAIFDAQFPVVYNTVFNRSIFRDWFAADAPGTPKRNVPLKPAAEIRSKLHAEGITNVYVNWEWIRRYREPGNYGYTDFVTPARFERLLTEGVLGAPTTFGVICTEGMEQTAVERLQKSVQQGSVIRCQDGLPVILTGRYPQRISGGELATVNDLGASLLKQYDGHQVLINAQVFPVK